MGSSKGKVSAAKLPGAKELEPLLELQNRYNRPNINTPFGSQTYERNAQGGYDLNTSLSPGMEGIAQRAGGLAMTDSVQHQMPEQMNQIAGALSQKVGNRLGLDLGGSMNLTPQRQAKPMQGGQPMIPPNLPPPGGPQGQPPPGGQPPPTMPPGWQGPNGTNHFFQRGPGGY